MTERAGPIEANRTRSALSAMLALAVDRGLLPANPVSGSCRLPERARNRALDAGELARLLAVVRSRGDVAGAAVELLVLTCARRGELLAARWSDFRLDGPAPVWIKPAATTKRGVEHVVPLSPAAVRLLRRLQEPYALPDARGVIPITGGQLRHAWEAIRAAAELGDVRIHDLRRSSASALAAAGVPEPTIAAMLGHAPGSRITLSVYVRSSWAGLVDASAQLGELAR